MLHVVANPTVFILFYEQCWVRGVFKVIKNDHFLVFLTVRVLFPKFFAQVKEWLILELHETRMEHLI